MDRKHQNAAVRRNGSKTRATAVRPNGDPLEAAMQLAVERVRSMSQKERVQSLIKAGILTAKGKLAAAYR
jgi:hypothetical protein